MKLYNSKFLSVSLSFDWLTHKMCTIYTGQVIDFSPRFVSLRCVVQIFAGDTKIIDTILISTRLKGMT